MDEAEAGARGKVTSEQGSGVKEKGAQEKGVQEKGVQREGLQAKQAPSPQQRIRWHAMEMLARRDHSRRELQSKLARRYPDAFELVDRVLEELTAAGLQSDQRFTESYVAMRKRKGYGPNRISMELKDKGVERDMIAAELERPEHDWQQQALQVWQKKFSRPAAALFQDSDSASESSCIGARSHRLSDYDVGAVGWESGSSEFERLQQDRQNQLKQNQYKKAAQWHARQVRFLQYRGFLHEHIHAVLNG